ncbi:MAG: lipid II flippase MurJ, partial [Pseudoclavibacter sp.]
MARGGIGRASALLASGTLVSRVLGFVKAIVLAQTIGVIGTGADAFANANMLPSSIYSLIAGGVINAVLVPQVVRAARHADGGQQYINRLVTLAISGLAVITVALTVAVPIVARVYGGSLVFLNPELLGLIIALGFWCMPQVFFYGLYVVLGEVLNARGMFGPFTWAPVLNNVIGIGFLVVFSVLFGADPTGERNIADWTPDMIALLGSTTTAGVACQALILFFFWRKVGLTFRPDFHWRGTGLGRAGKLVSWTFGLLLVMQFSGLIETIVLNIAAGGQAVSVAAFQNAYLIFVLPHSIITVSIATAYFTRMSAAAGEGRLGDLVRDFSGGARLIGLFIVFAAWGIAVISPSFARIFESTQQGVTDIAIVLCCFLLGLVSFCGLFLVQRAFFALEDTRTQFWVFLATMPLHVLGMAISATLDVSMIAAGLALSQSAVSIVRLVVLLVMLRLRVGHLDTRRIVRSYVRFAVGAVIAALIGFGLMWLLGAYVDDGFARSGIAQALLACAIGGLVMGVIYLGIMFVMRSPELRDGLDPVLRRVGLGRIVDLVPARSGDGGAGARSGAGDADGFGGLGDGGRDGPGDDHGPDAPLPSGAPGRGDDGAGSGEAGDARSAWPDDAWRFEGDDEGGLGRDSRDGRDGELAPVPAGGAPGAPRGPRGPRRDVEWTFGQNDEDDALPARARPADSPAGAARPDHHERQARDDAWSAWLGSTQQRQANEPINPDVERREEGAYGAALASMNATGDLSTAGILLPLHATGSQGPRTRRERRLLEQDAARQIAEKRERESASHTQNEPSRPGQSGQRATTGTPGAQGRPDQQGMQG